MQKGTTSEPNAADFFETNHINYELVEADTVADVVANYLAGKCNALSTDESQLFALRSQFPKPGDHMILPDVISKEPLGPVVRQDDMQWFNIVKWVNFALLDAEEMGVGSKTIDEALKSQKPGGEAPGRHGGRLRQAARPLQRLGGECGPRGRQLRRSV